MLKPNYVDAYIVRSQAHLLKRDFDSAIADCQKVMELNPKTAEPYIIRAIVHSLKGEFDTVIADCEKAIEREPNAADAYVILGMAFGNKNDFDSAIANYTKAIKLEPKHADVYYERGKAYLNIGEFDLAIADLTAAMDNGIDVGTAFRNAYQSLAEFKEKTGIKSLPEDIVAILKQHDGKSPVSVFQPEAARIQMQPTWIPPFQAQIGLEHRPFA